MTELTGTLSARPGFKAYYEICKPGVVTLIALTAVVGMLLSTPGLVPWQALVFGTLGITLAAASGAAINHVIDQRIDALMQRTCDRPVASGQLTTLPALAFAIMLATISMMILALLVNPLTAVLTLLSMIGYAVVYTAFLKRTTHHNTVLGGIAGAMPPLLGWTAVTGQVSLEGIILVLIIFVWTPPHFWPLAIKRRKEYARAEIPMLPVVCGVATTKRHILYYTIALIFVSALPFAIGMSGLLYLVGALGLGAGFLSHAVRLYREPGDGHCMRTFGYSIFYLNGLFLILLVDHYARALL
ncbi:MAG: protoheme IX farnesyltransferase [Gammaproteobacteria bacterium]|nr:protoheme IX farnesyltransferase [Gammaproteobacteria bacterium]